MKVSFEISEQSAEAWKSLGVKDAEGKKVAAGDVAKQVFLQWLRQNMRLD